MTMNKTITIDPVTRIEGHAKVFINLTEDGQLESAGLVVNELRGFEKILTGMDADTSRDFMAIGMLLNVAAAMGLGADCPQELADRLLGEATSAA